MFFACIRHLLKDEGFLCSGHCVNFLIFLHLLNCVIDIGIEFLSLCQKHSVEFMISERNAAVYSKGKTAVRNLKLMIKIGKK